MAWGPFSTSNYLSLGAGAVTAYPLTISCWFMPLDVTSAQVLVCLPIPGTGFNDRYALEFRGDVANDPLRVGTTVGAVFNNLDSSNSGSALANLWNHGAGVWTSTTDRAVFLNGTKTTNTTSQAGPVSTNTFIGRRGTASDAGANTYIAWAAIWNAALTDAEIAALRAGARPERIRPQSLVLRPSMSRVVDDIKAAGWTANGSVGVASIRNPRIY